MTISSMPAPAPPITALLRPVTVRTIAVVAHDAMKPTLVDWATRHQAQLAHHDLCGTGTTGKLVEEATGLPVERFRSGPLGGDQQLGARIADGAMDLVVFFWDPLSCQPHDADVQALLRLAVVWNVPVATNPATADYLLTSPLLANGYEPATPDHDRGPARRPELHRGRHLGAGGHPRPVATAHAPRRSLGA